MTEYSGKSMSDQKNSPCSNSESPQSLASNSLELVKLKIARQYATRPWRVALDQLIFQTAQGRSLVESLREVRGPGASKCLAVLREVMNTRDPIGSLIELLQLRNLMRRQWSSMALALVYPIFITIVALMLSLYLGNTLTGQESVINQLYVDLNGWDFISSEEIASITAAKLLITDQQNVFIGISFIIGWCLLVAATLWLLGPKWSFVAVVSGLPLLGRPYRWLALAEILGQIYLFVAQGKTLEESLRSVERGLQHHGMGKIVESIARRVEAGASLGQSLRMSILSDSLCRPALSQLDNLPDNAGSRIKETSDLMFDLAQSRCHLLSSSMPVILLLFAGSIIWSTIQCYIVFITVAVKFLSTWM